VQQASAHNISFCNGGSGSSLENTLCWCHPR